MYLLCVIVIYNSPSYFFFFFSSRRRHTRFDCDWSSDVCSSDLISVGALRIVTNPSPARLREAAARAWPVIDSLYGSEARQLEQHPYLIAPYDPDTTSPKPMRRGAIQVPWDKDVASLAMLLLTTVPIGRPDAALQNWLGGSVVPIIHPVQ